MRKIKEKINYSCQHALETTSTFFSERRMHFGHKKNVLFCLLSNFIFCVSVSAQTKALAPDSILQFEFPELSPNMRAMFLTEGRHKDSVYNNVVAALLPANYSAKKKYPIVVSLDGGTGGSVFNMKWLREVFGPNDYIIVRLPLFKAEKILTDPANGLMILPKDYEVISKNYRVILEKLFKAVPNITSKGSAIGGFSNGAHTTAVLLAGGDDFIQKHFDHFYFIEGGINRLDKKTLEQKKLRSARFLFMLGDRGQSDPFERFGKDFMEAVKESGISYTNVVMRGYGHDFPMDYKKVFAAWVRHQPLPDIAPKLFENSSAPVTGDSTKRSQ